MEVPRFLVFDYGNDFIDLSIEKIKGEKLIIFGKKLTDIQKFKPKTVICYQNNEIVDMCKKLKVNCVHIHHLCMFRQNPHKNLSDMIISRLDLEKIRKDDRDYRYNFSMIEDCTDIISGTMVNFEPGNNVLVNPGMITTSEILDFFNIGDLSKYKDKKGENRTSRSSFQGRLGSMEYFFKKDTNKKVNIYLPTYHRIIKTQKSLKSIVEDVKLSSYDVKIYIGDNSPNFPDLRNWLRSIECENVNIYFSDKNLGKSGMVNYLHNNSRECDYIFSLDSDMIAAPGTNFVDNMLFHLTRLENCGLISSNQSECSQHWIGKTVEIVTRNNIEVGYSKDGVGIAGGCICMRSTDWEEVGMYKENHDIYTGDDGILTHNVMKILKKYVYISMGCTLIHPLPTDDEKEYTEWKMESWKRDNLQFLKEDFKGKNTKGFYD